MLYFGIQIGFSAEEKLIISKNLNSVLIDPFTIISKLEEDLQAGRVLPANDIHPFISSPLSLIEKHDGGFRRIHYLSYPLRDSVNDGIPEEYSNIKYTTFDEIITMIKEAGRHSIIIKRDIKDAFRNISMALNNRWLLGFS